MKLFRNIFALILIPGAAACGYVLLKTFLSFSSSGGQIYTPFWIGVLSYAVLQIAFYKPMRTYVFGHELTHALAGVLSGAKIKKFKVSQNSGSVVLTKDNVWITLAPYFFPLYAFIIIAVYVMLGYLVNIKLFYSYFLFAAGFSIAFHIALTIYALGIEQPDLKVYGVFFSYVIIIAVNIAVFSLLFVLVFPEAVKAGEFFSTMFDAAAKMYLFLYDGIVQIFAAFSTKDA